MDWRRIGDQAIIWTNANPIHWRIYAALGGDELTHLFLAVYIYIYIVGSYMILFVYRRHVFTHDMYFIKFYTHDLLN